MVKKIAFFGAVALIHAKKSVRLSLNQFLTPYRKNLFQGVQNNEF